MQYIGALTPPIVMAIAFALMIRALFRNQGGANAAREDAVADAIIAAAAATPTPRSAPE
jgi:ABC-type Co2+ transport system permease subunit